MRTNRSINHARPHRNGPGYRAATDLIHSDDQSSATSVQRRLDVQSRFSYGHRYSVGAVPDGTVSVGTAPAAASTPLNTRE